MMPLFLKIHLKLFASVTSEATVSVCWKDNTFMNYKHSYKLSLLFLLFLVGEEK